LAAGQVKALLAHTLITYDFKCEEARWLSMCPYTVLDIALPHPTPHWHSLDHDDTSVRIAPRHLVVLKNRNGITDTSGPKSTKLFPRFNSTPSHHGVEGWSIITIANGSVALCFDLGEGQRQWATGR